MFIPKENRFVTVDTPVPDVKNNINNAANDILIENDSCVWVATQCGLFRYDPLRGGFRWYFKKDGLPANNSKGLAIDSDGMLWLTTSAGLCRFDRSKSAFTCFSQSDGLQSNEFNPIMLHN
jgi:ligand-binding sensor domain-containing protein